MQTAIENTQVLSLPHQFDERQWIEFYLTLTENQRDALGYIIYRNYYGQSDEAFLKVRAFGDIFPSFVDLFHEVYKDTEGTLEEIRSSVNASLSDVQDRLDLLERVYPYMWPYPGFSLRFYKSRFEFKVLEQWEHLMTEFGWEFTNLPSEHAYRYAERVLFRYDDLRPEALEHLKQVHAAEEQLVD